MRRKEMMYGDLVYRSAKGIIRLSLTKDIDIFGAVNEIWEIFYINKNYRNIEKYEHKQDALKRIEELLEDTPHQTYPLPIEARDGDNL